MSPSVVVLGGTGMLGSAVVAELTSRRVDLTATTTDRRTVPRNLANDFTEFSAGTQRLDSVVKHVGPGDYVVNCIGLIKHHIDDRKPADRRRAIELNATLPYELAELADRRGFRVIQIATDCIFSGHRGQYDETSSSDASDVYGQSKNLGEVPSDRFLHLRASIIGRELKTHLSLLDWTLAHSARTSIRGFTDHRWNGVTTKAFASVAGGLIAAGDALSGTFHLIPQNALSKHELVEAILSAFGRQDVLVEPFETGMPIDRTLTTIYPEVNQALWAGSSYRVPPTVEQMIADIGH